MRRKKPVRELTAGDARLDDEDLVGTKHRRGDQDCGCIRPHQTCPGLPASRLRTLLDEGTVARVRELIAAGEPVEIVVGRYPEHATAIRTIAQFDAVTKAIPNAVPYRVEPILTAGQVDRLMERA